MRCQVQSLRSPGGVLHHACCPREVPQRASMQKRATTDCRDGEGEGHLMADPAGERSRKGTWQ